MTARDARDVIAAFVRRIRCRLGRHERLDLIQDFGRAQHIACPDCGKQMGLHKEMRVVLPWTKDMDDMYRSFGHDIDGPLAKWREARSLTGGRT